MLHKKIKKLYSILVIILLFLSCNDNQSSKQQFTIYPEDTIMIQFDIDTFNKYKIDDSFSKVSDYSYTTKEGIYIEQQGTEEGYFEERVYTDSLFSDIFNFYPNGKLQRKSRFFKYGTFFVGRTIYYDESGNITEIEDNDAPYKFTLDEVLEFINQNIGDLDTIDYSIARDYVGERDIQYNKALQNLPIDTYFWGIKIKLPFLKYRKIILNADNGEVTYDKIPADDYTDE